ncbi:hypothetical protein Hdeb2414_s0275g00854151 [Helianthus debilis subsp. tardiflorus]
MSENVEDVVEVEGISGVMRPLKWEEGLFEQVVRGQQFAHDWDARYLAKGQTTADAPPCCITLFADLFGDGNFRLPATDFFCGILSFYHFHVQLSSLGMVRIRHFEFCCRSQGVIPVAMELYDPEPIPKEDLKIPKGAAWYKKLKPLPNQAFGEHMLVAAGMSDKWPSTVINVLVLLLDDQGNPFFFVVFLFYGFFYL